MDREAELSQEASVETVTKGYHLPNTGFQIAGCGQHVIVLDRACTDLTPERGMTPRNP